MTNLHYLFVEGGEVFSPEAEQSRVEFRRILHVLDMSVALCHLEASLADTFPKFSGEARYLRDEEDRLRSWLGPLLREYVRRYGEIDMPLFFLGDSEERVHDYALRLCGQQQELPF